MQVDNASLLIAIAFSSAALTLALIIGWYSARRDFYLIYWAAGIALVVIAVMTLGLRNGAYGLAQQIIPFVLLLGGMSSIYAGMRRFRRADASDWPPTVLLLVAGLSMSIIMLAGYSGTGTIVLNLAAALYMVLCAVECWRGRVEAMAQLVGNTALFMLTALSFAACAAVLLAEQTWVLQAPPANWAEDINSIMCLVGLTGIGALSLTLSHNRASQRHRDEANTDPLTGVLNRRALFARFPDAADIVGHAVVMFDLDHFKQINDRLGHAEGDKVLQAFAGVLRMQLRQFEIAARIGGEEFCVILPQADQARDTAERIRLAFAAMALGDGLATVSAGVASIGPGERFSAALSRADEALYRAKDAGRNQVQQATFFRVA